MRTARSVLAGLSADGAEPAAIHVDALIGAVAAAQGGAIDARQLAELGIRRGALGSRRSRGLLVAVHKGVYLWGGQSMTQLGQAHAAILACGDGAAISHRWAAALLGIGPAVPGPVEVTVVGRRVDVAAVRAHEARSLVRADVRVHDGLPITAPARTLLDLAAVLSPQQLAGALEQAQVKRLVTAAGIEAALRRAPGRRGTRALRALAAEPAFTRSQAERRLLALLRAAKLPEPAFNDVAEGLEIDVLWRAQRVTLEFDSYAFHATRAAFERDRVRDAVLTRARYTPLRTTWRELTTESHSLVARIAQALATQPS